MFKLIKDIIYVFNKLLNGTDEEKELIERLIKEFKDIQKRD